MFSDLKVLIYLFIFNTRVHTDVWRFKSASVKASLNQFASV